MSHEILPQLEWDKRTILWLDYERPLNSDQIFDVALASANLASGSVILVTIPVDPGEVEANVDIGEKRLADLRSRVGSGRIPPTVEGKDLAKWGLAKVSRQIIVNQITKTLSERSGALAQENKVRFTQIFNFHYADGIKMLTVGGMIVNQADESRLSAAHFEDMEFYRPNDNPYLIESPLLTWREIKLLDNSLPHSAPDIPEPGWIPEGERKKYAKVYRYFPSYSEVEN